MNKITSKNLLSNLKKNYEQLIHYIRSKKRPKAIDALAGLDSLTHVPNRYLLQEMLTECLSRAQKNQNTLALLYINIDNFKGVNDAFGYATGDIFLKNVANRLKEYVKEKYAVARVCSDEFSIILENIQDINKIIAMAQYIVDDFKRPFILDEKNIVSTVSVGIIVSDGENSAEVLMQRASHALKQAKDSRNCYKFYNKAIPKSLEHYMLIVQHLRDAIQKNQFELYYQPKVNADSKSLVGMEALVRWNNLLLKNPPPNEFIPIAEEIGLINSLGAWVIKTALQQYDVWYQKNSKMQNVRISINLSPLQLSDNMFIETLMTTLKETKIPTKNILFEITETALMKKALDIKSLAQTFLMELGIGLSIDDFGTGYSSFTYLKELPVKELKIDKSFIDDIGKSNNSESIIKAMINLAKTLELEVVAEGVETREQLDFLKTHRCQTIQGYYFSKPLSVSDMTNYIEHPMFDGDIKFQSAKNNETNTDKQKDVLNIPVYPVNESQRIETLHALNILDTAPDERFDRITRLAKKLFDVPISLVSLVDSDRQWFKSKQGLDINETPRDISFCSHAILSENILVVNNAIQDERFCHNPLVVGEPNIRFYAGHPIVTSNDCRLGTICLIDTKPREFNEEEQALLRDLAKIVEDEIDNLRLTNTDE